MERKSRISLDDPAFRGRLRGTRPAGFDSPTRSIQDVRTVRIAPTPSTLPAAPHPKPVQHVVHSPLPKNITHTTALRRTSSKRPDLPRQSRSSVLKRQIVEKAARKYQKHHRPVMPTLLSAMAVLLFTAGLFVVFSSFRTNDKVKAQVKQLSKTAAASEDGMTDGVPSEDNPPNPSTPYTVAPDMPKRFTIDKIGVNARVRRLGISNDNVLKAPNNIFDAGWYDGSAKPGENGTVVLDGHVSGPTKRGVFYNIGTLKAGDKVNLERGDGKIFSYTVTGTQVYDNDKVDMAKVLTSSVPGKSGLNFMTCTGRFNVRTNSFEQRVVVFTIQDS